MNKIIQIFFLLIVTLIYGCRVDPNPCNLPEAVLADLRRVDSSINIPEIREQVRQSMKGNFNEPSLLDAQNETYRFIWSSSFGGAEVYRIEKIEDQVLAIQKIFDSRDTVGVTRELEFSLDDWNRLTSELKSKGFWTYPTSRDRQVLDGASWMLEAYKPKADECTMKNFHGVYRTSPIDTTYIEMCKIFYDLKVE